AASSCSSDHPTSSAPPVEPEPTPLPLVDPRRPELAEGASTAARRAQPLTSDRAAPAALQLQAPRSRRAYPRDATLLETDHDRAAVRQPLLRRPRRERLERHVESLKSWWHRVDQRVVAVEVELLDVEDGELCGPIHVDRGEKFQRRWHA